MNRDDLLKELQLEVVALLKTAGKDATDEVNKVARYAAERAEHLALIVGQPGYNIAVDAEVKNVALAAGLAAVSAGDSVDAKIVGGFRTVLRFGSKLLSTLVIV